jgi:hypothetical protein
MDDGRRANHTPRDGILPRGVIKSLGHNFTILVTVKYSQYSPTLPTGVFPVRLRYLSGSILQVLLLSEDRLTSPSL